MKTLLLSLILALAVFAQQPPLRPVKVTLTSSSTDTYAGTATPTLSAYVTGQIILFTANTANTGAASINVDSVGALTIVKLGGGITTALADNDIRSGQAVMCQYDGTNCQMLSQLGNAAAGGGSSITTLTGYGSANSINNTTTYFPFNNYNMSVAESSGDLKIMTGGTIRNLAVKITTPNAANTTLTCTVRKIAAGAAWNASGTNTAVTFTTAAAAAEGWYTSGATSDTIADGERITMGCTAAGGTTSGAIRGYSLELVR